MQGFKAEWQKALPQLSAFNLVSVYFGGGTPSLLGSAYIDEILNWIQPSNNVEITLEANPENFSEEMIRNYKGAGINRLSIGAQAFDDELLITLGRTHNASKTSIAVNQAFKAGIENITIDLMYDLPNQTYDHWQKTLRNAAELPISHLSLYNLTIEPNTLFYKQRKSLILPDEDASLAMYLLAAEVLEKKGLKQYEISAFALPGKQSKHNLGYWTARQFLGFGPSAFSYWEGRRFKNIANLRKYHRLLMNDESPVDFEEKLDLNSSQRELLAIRLRLLEGVDIQDFQQKHGKLEKDVIATLNQLVQKGWLTLSLDTYKLTQQGILFYDSLATEII